MKLNFRHPALYTWLSLFVLITLTALVYSLRVIADRSEDQWGYSIAPAPGITLTIFYLVGPYLLVVLLFLSSLIGIATTIRIWRKSPGSITWQKTVFHLLVGGVGLAVTSYFIFILVFLLCCFT